MRSLKKIITVCIILFSIVIGKAQVGIGTTAPDGALDITSSTDGLLIPRVALTITTSALPLTSPTISELVYNSATVADVTPGYYYWNGTIWVRLAAGVTNDWSILGNAGTTPTTNFIGTTDNQDFAIRRNNLRAGYIGDATFAPVTFDSNNGNTSFGANSLVNPTVNISPQQGVRNTAFGANTMPSLTIGNRNVGIGESVLFSNSTGNENTAMGVGALYSNTTGNSNVAVGRNALTASTIASNNTAVGFTALRNTTGTDNTAIGVNAGSNLTTGSRNIMIGASTAATAIGVNDQLNIGNTIFGNMSGALAAGVNTTRTIGVNVLAPLAALDVTSSNNGILIPRIALLVGSNSALPLVAPTTSEMIYNLATINAGVNSVTPGFYYWNGSSWVRFSTGVQTGWLTTGNTVGAAGSFIGTLDNFDVAFRRNNLASGFIGANSTAFGVGTLAANTGTNNTAFGTSALAANDTPSNNTAVGFNALRINTNNAGGGNQNTAVGSGALTSLNGGIGNTAVGYNALNASATLSQFNTAVGAGALSGTNNAASQDNVAVGYNSLRQPGVITRTVAIGSNALGNAANNSTRNTAIGAFAGNATTTGNDNVFIGQEAGNLEAGTSSNKLYIENTNANASNALIYGEFDTNILRVNGTLQVNNPAGLTGYALPNVRGTVGQFLQTDGAGATSWASVVSTTDWSVTGNAGLSSATNFLGTTDAIDVAFRRNNLAAGRIGATSTSFGVGALSSGAASNSAAFGNNALAINTTGAGNVAVGTSALAANITSANNTAVGFNALAANTASDNTALGYRTMAANTTGNQNVAIGFNALQANTLGSRNVSIGYQSLLNDTESQSNTSIGYRAMATLNGPAFSSNVAIGSFALENAASVINSTFIGAESGRNSTGNNSTGIGRRALGSLAGASSGIDNTAIGHEALARNTIGQQNTVIGGEGMSLTTTGNFNTSIGYRAGNANTTGSSNIFIGHNAGIAEVGTSSNKLYISNSATNAATSLIYGEFSPSRILRTNSTFQIGDPAGTGYQFPIARGTINQVLQTNATGQLNWVDPSSLTITEVDPKVSSTTANVIPKWNGTNLVDGIVTDDGTNVTVAGNTITTTFQMTTTPTANFVLQSDGAGNGSWANPTVKPYVTTGAAVGNYIVSLTEYTIRVFNGVSQVTLPDAVVNLGKVYIIIGSNGIGVKTLATSGGVIYDDDVGATVITIGSNERISVQSDGTDWIVIYRE